MFEPRLSVDAMIEVLFSLTMWLLGFVVMFNLTRWWWS